MTGTLKRLITAAAIILAAVACKDLTPEVDQLKLRLEALEKRVDGLNDQIAQLRSLVQQINTGGYVTAVLPDRQDEAIVGYTLVFNDGSTSYISLGHQEEPPQEVPQIGIRQDTDGIWYWTLGGQWLIDRNGNRVPASPSNEKPEQPQLKMEDDVWYISYDGGATWETISTKASGDSIFRSVDASNPDFVIITMTDGGQIKLPTWTAFSELQQQVKQLNINLSSISRIVSAMQDNDYLISTTPFVEDGEQIGWILNFSKSGLVVIYSSRGASAPQIGVRRDSDGVYYWTIGGEWLLDEAGKKVQAEGSQGTAGDAPKIKIEDSYWWISYDDGATWERLDRATGEDGADGDSFFREVDNTSDEFILLVLADGSSLKVPKYIPLDIVLDLPPDMVIGTYDLIEIPYKIIGTEHVDSYVSVLSNGQLEAEVIPDTGGWAGGADWDGYLTVYNNIEGGSGDIVAMLSTNTGYTIMRTAHFSAWMISAFSIGSDYMTDLRRNPHQMVVPPEGGTVSLIIGSNYTFVVDASEVPWINDIRLETTDASDYKKLSIDVAPSTEGVRYGSLYLDFNDGSWAGHRSTKKAEIILYQTSSTVNAARSLIQAISDARTYELPLEGVDGDVEAVNFSHSDWLSCTVECGSDGSHMLLVSLDANYSNTERWAKVAIKSGGLYVCYIDVQQDTSTYWGDTDSMILSVLALPENGYEVCLPITGELSVTADWGDGTVSLLNSEDGSSYPVRHTYKECFAPTTFTVCLKGNAKSIRNCDSISSLVTVEAIKQWGTALHVNDMKDAFRNCTTLRSIARDPLNSLISVMTFEGAFQDCSNLVQVPTNLFDGAYQATNFTNTFKGVNKVTTESPYSVIDGKKVHLYDRDGTQIWEGQYYHYTIPKKYSGCFAGGNWADQEAIHAAGWD